MNQSILDVFRELSTHPADVLIRHWNWKSAILSSGMRAAIFLFSNLSAGWHAAASAMLVEFLFRPILSGFLGSLTQAFRFAQPAWASGLTVMLILPTISHLIEFAVHWLHGTPNLTRSIFWSICFSWLSTLMNLYAMRRGVLVVNSPDASTLRNDLRRIPAVLGGFFAVVPLALYRFVRGQVSR